MNWSVFVYRRLCRVDAGDRAQGRVGVPRFEYLTGTEADMRFYFEEFKANPQVLAVELHGSLVAVVERFDRLLELLPDVDPAALREAVLEPRLLAPLPAAPSRPAG
jgi:hypothetical protein